jgi:hypothetical protein
MDPASWMYQQYPTTIFGEWYRRQHNVDPEYSFEPINVDGQPNPSWRCRLTCPAVDLVQIRSPNGIIEYPLLNFSADAHSKVAAKRDVATVAMNAYTDNWGRLLSRPGR